MKRTVIWSLASVLFTAALAAPLSVFAEQPPASDPVATLTEKGLKKTPGYYVLPEETTLVQRIRDLTEAKSKLAKDAAQRRKIEKFIARTKDFISGQELEQRKLYELIGSATDATQHNRAVGQINAITLQIKEALDYKDKQEKALRELGDGARSDYIGLVMGMEKEIDAIEAKYKELEADAQVTDAITNVKPKAKLGPSEQFQAAARRIRKERGDIAAETIHVTMDGGVPWLDVTINGSTRTFIFDTGASIISLPHDVAKSMELVPPKEAPIVQITLADGKQVEAKLIILKSVRVGIFEVNDVEAAVLPETLVAATPLLGGSFLEHFIHKLDRGKGELTLARVGAGAQKDEQKAGQPAEKKAE